MIISDWRVTYIENRDDIQSIRLLHIQWPQGLFHPACLI